MGIVIPIMMLAFSKSIMGVNMLKIADQKPQIIKDCLDELVTLWKQNKIAPVSGGIYKPEQLALAHKDLELRKIKGKAIIRLQ
jgi:NADPH2:quinone reductase